MMPRPLFKTLAIAVTVGSLALASHAQARDLRLAPGVPPAHPAHTPLYTEFVDLLQSESEGRLGGQVLGAEVASIGNMRNAIRSGLVEAGLFLPAYFPADLPDINLVGDMALLGTNSYAMGAAMTEYIATCEACQEELKRLGIVYTSSHSTDTYQILTTSPVHTADDLRGLRLRVGGPQYSRWAEAMDATPASIPVGDTFESLSQGVIDGTVASIADIISFRLEDVISHVTMHDLGTFHSTISHAVGQNVWQSLSPEDREVLVRASTKASALAIQRWAYEMIEESKELAGEHGIEIIEPSEELLAASQAFAEQDIERAARQAEERYGVSDAAAKLDRFIELVDKWNAIVEEVGEDPEAVTDAINREVWDNVDFSTYGI